MIENAVQCMKLWDWPMVFLRYLGIPVSRLSRRLYRCEYCAIADFLFLRCSSSGDLAVEQNHVVNVVEESNSSGRDHEAKILPAEERCELLSEVFMEVPNVNQHDTDEVPLDGNDVGEVVPEGNVNNGKLSLEENGASKEKSGSGNVNTVEKPNSQSGGAAGKTGGTAYLRRGRRKN